MLSYWTAYLKAHYPAEYMAALLTSRRRRARQARGVPERVPPDGDQGAAARRERVDRLLRRRRRGHPLRPRRRAQRRRQRRRADHRGPRRRRGAFTSFHDFLRKVPLGVANKRTIESLIKAGAFDSLGATRRSLLEIHEDAVEAAVSIKRNEANGQVGFDFDGLLEFEEQPDHVPDRPEWGKKREARVRARDARALRLRPSAGRPRGRTSPSTRRCRSPSCCRSRRRPTASRSRSRASSPSVQHRVARNSGNQYGIVQIEDFGGTVSVMFLGKAYQEFAPALVADSVVVVRGRVSARATTASTSTRTACSRPTSARAAARDRSRSRCRTTGRRPRS